MELQELYIVTIHNRYADLSNNVDYVTEKYGKLVEANTETAENMIPVEKKNKRRNVAEDPRIEDARTEVQKAFENYQLSCNNEARQELQSRKEKLQQVYNEIQEEDLEEIATEVKNVDVRSKHAESWRLINNITGHKAAKRGIIKGNSRKERNGMNTSTTC